MKFFTLLSLQFAIGFHVIYQTRYPNTEKRVEIRRQRSIFDEIQSIWIADETLSRVFDIYFQTIQKLRSKRRNKIVKIYANLYRVSKPPSRLGFPLFDVMNY